MIIDMNEEKSAVEPVQQFAAGSKGFYKPALDVADVEGRKFKIEINSELENFFLIAAVVFVALAAILLFLVFIDDAKINAAKEYLKIAGAVSALLGAVMAGLFYSTDNYYIMDAAAGKIMFNFKFFGYRKITPVIDFVDLYAITVTGVVVEEIIFYRIIAITKTAAVIVLSELERSPRLDDLNRKAGAMAAVAGCLYAECPRRGLFFIDHVEGEIKSVSFTVK